MKYETKIIHSQEEIENCNKFPINHFLWNCVVKPEAFGKMGYLPDKGLFLKMVCLEENPKRIYKNFQDPVASDSAMEAFFAFAPQKEKGFQPYDDCMYLNIEINANGALHAKYGQGRKGRIPLTIEQAELCRITSKIETDKWSITFFVPLELLKEIYQIDQLELGDEFFCNFYKISESKEIEHYAAFSPIDSETPNFHLPRFFAPAKIVL